MYEEQLSRWRLRELSTVQRTEVERLTQHLTQLRGVVQQILTMAKGLKQQTIEWLLEKDDVDVALDFLAGKLKR